MFQEGVVDPPSVSSISRMMRERDGRRQGSEQTTDPEGKKDYTIDTILRGKL